MGHAHRRRTRCPLPARRHPAVGRRRRVQWRGQGQGRPDHGVLQGCCVLSGEGRGGAADCAQGRGQGDPGQRHRRGDGHRAAEGRRRLDLCRDRHRSRHLGQGGAVRARGPGRRVGQSDRAVRPEPGGRAARRTGPGRRPTRQSLRERLGRSHFRHRRRGRRRLRRPAQGGRRTDGQTGCAGAGRGRRRRRSRFPAGPPTAPPARPQCSPTTCRPRSSRLLS